MNVVVADTSPLNYMIQLGLIAEVRAIYNHIVLPFSVHNEMLHFRAPESVRNWAANLPEWIELRRAHAIDPSLPLQLGAGEREAISLALDLRASILLIDDQPGRLAAEQRHIPVVGTLAILLQAALLTGFDYDAKIDELRLLGFRASDSLLKAMKETFVRSRAQGM